MVNWRKELSLLGMDGRFVSPRIVGVNSCLVDYYAVTLGSLFELT